MSIPSGFLASGWVNRCWTTASGGVVATLRPGASAGECFVRACCWKMPATLVVLPPTMTATAVAFCFLE